MIRNPIDLYRDFRAVEALKHSDNLPYRAEILSGDDIQQARRMLASAYVEKGIVSADELTPDHTLNAELDPYWEHSIYYGVRDERDPSQLLIASRFVLVPEGQQADGSLQMHFEDIDPAVADELRVQDPSTIAEFAAYVKRPGLDPITSRIVSMYLIREMVSDSRDHGIKTWVFGLRPELRNKYEKTFGPALDRCGDSVRLGAFKKASFVPYRIDVEASWQRLMQSSRWRLGSRAIAAFVGNAYQQGPRDTNHDLFAAHTMGEDNLVIAG